MRVWRRFAILLVAVQIISRATVGVEGQGQGQDTTLSTTGTSSTTSKPPDQPPEILNLKFVNNLGYQWYPVKDNVPCKADALTDCKGGLSCLAGSLKDDKDTTLLSAGNTLTDATGAVDFFKILKHDPAVTALKALRPYNLQALALGPDVYRYGVDLANKFTENFKDDKTAPRWIACNFKSEKTEFACAFNIPAKEKQTCSIRVLGFANAEKMKNVGEGVTVSDEVESITEYLKKDERKSQLTVVMGEGTEDLGKKISEIDGVDLVLLSGNTGAKDGDDVCKLVSEKDKPQKYVCSKLLNGAYVQLKLTVQPTECRIVKLEPAEPKTFASTNSADCKIDDADSKKSIDAAINEGFEAYNKESEKINATLSFALSTESCFKYECTIGSMAADAVAAIAATKTASPLQYRAVILPAIVFKKDATLPANQELTKSSIKNILDKDELLYNVTLSKTELKEIVEKMGVNASGDNFPQVSGIRLDIDLTRGTNNKVRLMHILRNFMYDNIRFTEASAKGEEYKVILPLDALKRSGISGNFTNELLGGETIWLSKVIADWLRESSSNRPVLPPPLGERIAYVVPPTQSFCENLIATTVCYTFLAVVTICSLLLLGYKIYSDRTAVHYVR